MTYATRMFVVYLTNVIHMLIPWMQTVRANITLTHWSNSRSMGT